MDIIIGFRSVYGIGFNANLAALSAFSLPVMPTYLVTKKYNAKIPSRKSAIFY